MATIRREIRIAASADDVWKVVGRPDLLHHWFPGMSDCTVQTVDGVTTRTIVVGAGIPMRIPAVLDRFVHHEPATYPLAVAGAGPDQGVVLSFDPQAFLGRTLPPLTRPRFLAIVASDVLALTLARKAHGHVDGFVVEGPTAGGHNAPPRGAWTKNDRGEPQYGPRDVVDLEKMKAIGRPFWLAGGTGSPEALQAAIAAGAEGVQVGTAFAMCADSGLRDDLRHALLTRVVAGEADVVTEAVASPTGFPFKVAHLEGTLSDPDVRAARPRVCDLGYLREAYRAADGEVGFRCPAEPANVFVARFMPDTAGSTDSIWVPIRSISLMSDP